MSSFASPAEVEKYIGGVFENGFAVPEISSELAKSGLVLRMNLSDPDIVITADLTEQKVYVGDDAPEANMTLTLTSDTANRFWQGKVSVPLAVARGQIKLSGALPKLIALLPSAKALNARYIEALSQDQRTDLIV